MGVLRLQDPAWFNEKGQENCIFTAHRVLSICSIFLKICNTESQIDGTRVLVYNKHFQDFLQRLVVFSNG